MTSTGNDLRPLTPAEIDSVAGGVHVSSHNGIPPIDTSPGLIASTSVTGGGSASAFAFTSSTGATGAFASSSVTGSGSASSYASASS